MKVFLCLTLLVALTLAEPPRYRQEYQQERQRYYVARNQEEITSASGPYAPSGWKPDGPAFNLPERQQIDNSYETTKQQYGPPPTSQRQFGAPSTPQQQYGAPFPQQQYGAPSAPERQYGAPSTPQQQYGAPSTPERQYGAPSAPQQQYGPPPRPERQYGAPSVPQQQYGVPEYTTTEEPNSTEDDEEPTTVRGLDESEPESISSANELEEDIDAEQPQQSGEYYVALPDGRLQRVRYVSRQDVEAMRYFAKIRAENVEPLRGPIYAYAPLQRLQIAPGRLDIAIAPQQTETEIVTNEKLKVQPIASQIQYQYENPASAVPMTSPYAAYTANYQISSNEPRYILAL